MKVMPENAVVIPISRVTDGTLYEPLPKQVEFHTAEETIRGYVGGVGCGKTLVLVVEIFRLASTYPGTIWIITAPSYPMLRDTTLLTWNEWIPRQALKRWIASQKKWLLNNGSEVWFRSTNDPESLRGPNVNGFGMDEGSKDKKKSYLILMGRIRRVVKYKDGTVAPNCGLIVTTPKGFDWVWNTLVKNRKPGMHKLIRASSTENVHLPVEFVDNLRSEYSGVFYRQEVLGEFVAHEGLVYSNFDRDFHVQPDSFTRKSHKYFIGSIDWGYANPMVGLIGSVDGDQRIHLVGEIYQRRLTLDEFAEKLTAMEKEFCKKLNIKYPFDITYWCDPSDTAIGAGSMMHALREKGFDVRKADNAILAGINVVQKRLEKDSQGRARLLVSPDCPNAISEFEQYSFEEFDAEKPYKDKPIKMNDHAMDAMRYMCMALEVGDKITSLDGRGLDW